MSVFFGVRKPIAPAPDLPTGDDFSEGISNWTAYASDADATMDWYQSNSLRLNINTGITSEQDRIQAVWAYGITGDFDIEVGYLRTNFGTVGAGRNYNWGLGVSTTNTSSLPDNIISPLWIADKSLMRSVYVLGGATQDSTDNTTKPSDPTIANLRLRITRVGTTFTTYHDPSTGSWSQIAQHSASSFNGVMYPYFSSFRFGNTAVGVKFTNFLVNSGTVVEP